MEEALYQLGRMAGAQAWQLTALVFIVGLSVMLCARHRPHLAFALWLLVMLKCVTPPLWSSPTGVFCWTGTIWPQSTEQCPRPATSPTVRPIDVGSPRPLQVVAPERHSTKPLPPGHADFRLSSQATSAGRVTSFERHRGEVYQNSADNARPWWLCLLLGGVAVWLLGIAAVVGIAVLRVAQYVRSIRRTALGHSAAYEKELAQLARRLKLRKKVKLLITSSRVGPAVIGLIRPTIVLPEVVVRGKSFADLEPIVAHELIHIRRGDLWCGVLQIIRQALWWFHPLVWWTTRLISREAERCCDEEVVGELACIPQAYARSLLDVLELKQTYRAAPVFPGVRPVDVTSQRLERIMKLGQGCHRRAPWWCWLVTIVGALAALPGAGLSTSAEDSVSATGRSGEESNVITRIYDVEDVLAAIEEDRGIDRKAAETMLISLVGTTCLGSEDSRDPGCRILKRQLVLSETEGVHERVANLLDNLRKHGAAELEIRIWVARGPTEILAKIVPKDKLVRPRSISTAFKTADAASLEITRSSSQLNNLLVRTVYQATHQVITSQEAERIIKQLGDGPETTIVMRPQLRVMSGQPAASEITALSGPLSPLLGASTRLPAMTGVIEGTAVEIQPVMRRSGKIWLRDCRLLLSKWTQLYTADAEQRQELVNIELPNPVANVFDASDVELAPGQTLLMKGARAPEEDGDEELLVVLQVQPVERSRASAKTNQVGVPIPSPERHKSAADAAAESAQAVDLSDDRWELSLQEVISIGLNNSKVFRNLGLVVTASDSQGSQGLLLSRYGELGESDARAAIRQFVKDTEDSYWDLWLACRRMEALRASCTETLAVWRELTHIAGGEAQVPREIALAREQDYFFRAQYGIALRELREKEQELRFLIGVARSDGRLLWPSSSPPKDRADFDWQTILEEALEKSPELIRQREAIRECEREITVLRKQLVAEESASELPLRRILSKIRNNELTLVREKARLEDMELQLSHLLTTAVRDYDLSYQNMQVHENRARATAAEIAELRTLVEGEAASLRPDSVELLLDAQRRYHQATIDQYRANAETANARDQIHLLKGTALDRYGISVK